MSLVLRPNCLVTNNSYHAQDNTYDGSADHVPCTLNPAAAQTFLINTTPINGLQVLSNVSAAAAAKWTIRDGRSYHYLGPVDSAINIRQDYTASSYGMSSSCASLTDYCMQGEEPIGAGTAFNCTANSFHGPILLNWQSQYYTAPTMSLVNERSNVFGFDNPFYFIGAVSLPAEWAVPQDRAGIGQEVHGNNFIIVNCTTTVYDIMYRVRNGSVVDLDAVPSNASVVNALQSPIGFVHSADFALVSGWSVAGLGSNTTQQMVDKWAAEYDRVAVSMAATALDAAPADAAQFRDDVLVTKVPLAPLACLLVANLLYTFVGAVLLVMAVAAGRDAEAHEVVSRLTVAGLVADRFEDQKARVAVEKPEEMFQELSDGAAYKIAVAGTQEGGHAYAAL